MSLQVNFTTYGHELKAAYEDILRPVNPQSGNNWALFGYDKGTNDLKVLGQGSGGLEELEDEFADGKIQYAFVRIVDPYSQLNKFVLIAWCGDGVPESKKGLFNSHLADVSQFLKGYHLQINARNEADVTPAQIMKRLDEGSGSKYSTHKETYEAERIRPLQSAYKKTEIPDIAALQRNPTKPEPAPKPVGYSSSASSAATPAKLEDRFNDSPSGLSNSPNRIREERLAREKEERERAQAEDSARSAREAFKSREADSLREQTSAREDELKRQKEHEQRQKREAREAEERHAQEQLNLQRQQEEEEEAAARQRQQQEDEDEEEERKAQQQRQRQKDEDEAKQRRQREQQEADDRKRRQAEEDEAAKERQRRQAEEEEEAERERQLQEEVNAAATQSVNLGADALLASTEHPELNVNGSVSAIVLYSYEKAEENEMSLMEGEIIRNVTELDVGWWSGESEDGTRSGLFPANYVEVIEHAQEQEQHHDAYDDDHAAAAAHDQDQGHEAEHDAYAAQHAHAAPTATVAGEEKKPTAVALYDYQAGEPNELSFNEGEAITEIDFVTEDWWSGKSETGATGLFPGKDRHVQ
ncbi:hypothetical protein BKA57DRAFT_394660 [Linnemannia elongata]|nr:hypothetical protein BKA57DRAFT_394660 [Linnemannia elongata]